MSDDVELERVEKIAHATMTSIRLNYRLGPQSRCRVYEALNALAYCVALVRQGASEAQQDGDYTAKEYFNRALRENLDDLTQQKAELDARPQTVN